MPPADRQPGCLAGEAITPTALGGRRPQEFDSNPIMGGIVICAEKQAKLRTTSKRNVIAPNTGSGFACTE